MRPPSPTTRPALEAAAAEHGIDLDTVEGRVAAERIVQGLDPASFPPAVLAQLERTSRPRPAVAS